MFWVIMMDYFSVTSKVQKLDILEQELLIYFTLQRRGGTLQKKFIKENTKFISTKL